MDMDIVSERTRVLHNFKMPAPKWGCRKVMICMKDDNLNTKVSSANVRVYRRSCDVIGRSSEFENDRRRVRFNLDEKLGFGSDGIEEQMIFDFPAAEKRRRTAVEVNETVVNETVNDSMKPWNLRTRRAKLDPEVYEIEGVLKPKAKSKPSVSPVRNEEAKLKVKLKLSGEKRERVKFSVSLSKQEMEEDFMAMTGHKLNRRPKKRPKTVQKQLDMMFPGLWLTEVNADLYKVADVV